ncbi:Fc.00g082950.m01.CDS01 [Cosmosporella sp. VM-42]
MKVTTAKIELGNLRVDKIHRDLKEEKENLGSITEYLTQPELGSKLDGSNAFVEGFSNLFQQFSWILHEETMTNDVADNPETAPLNFFYKGLQKSVSRQHDNRIALVNTAKDELCSAEEAIVVLREQLSTALQELANEKAELKKQQGSVKIFQDALRALRDK